MTSNITLDARYLEIFGAAQANISRGDTMARNALASIGTATKEGSDQPLFAWTDFVSPRGKSGFATLQVEQFDQVSETVAANLSARDKKLDTSAMKRAVGSRVVDAKNSAMRHQDPELFAATSGKLAKIIKLDDGTFAAKVKTEADKKEAEKGPDTPVAENALDYGDVVKAAIATALGLAHDGLSWDDKGDLVKDEQAIATDFDLAAVHDTLLGLWKTIKVATAKS